MSTNVNQEISDRIILLSGNDIRLSGLLSYCIGRLCLKSVKTSGNWEFDLSKIDVDHVVDWLKAALINDAEWLKNVDGQNRPKKLMKFSDFNSVVQEADKAMLLSAQRNKNIQLIEGDEELYQELDNGYYLVKLLTPAALDREGSQMQHCIGGGAYDKQLKNSNGHFLSLRDLAGKPHITVEIRDGSVVQLQGKQNKAPLLKYTKALSSFFGASKLEVNIPIHRLGYVISDEGKVFDIDKLPDGLKIKGDLDLSHTAITSLPDDLKVGGSLDINHTTVASLPANLKIGENLDLRHTAITSLPDDLKVGGRLGLCNTDITSLPDGLQVDGDLNLLNTDITSLPDGLEVGGSLYLRDTAITSLPANLKVGGGLDINRTTITSLPDDLEVGGSLTLINTPITSLPEGLEVAGNFYILNTSITSLPDGLEVGGSLSLFLGPSRHISLPTGLKVGGDFHLDNKIIGSLPDDLEVAGKIIPNNIGQDVLNSNTC